MKGTSTQKTVSMDFAECVKTMLFTVREAHGQVPGRAREPLFRVRGMKASLKGSRGALGRISNGFVDPLGVLGDIIFGKNRVLFEVIC